MNAAGFARTMDAALASQSSDPVKNAGSTDRVQRGEVAGVPQRASEVEVIRRGLLSPRCSEIAVLIAEGRSNKAIGGALNITEATVKVHLKTALRTAGLKNRTQLAIWWMQGGRFSASHEPVPPPEPIVFEGANLDTLRTAIAAGLDLDFIRGAYHGRATDAALVPALFQLLRERGQASPL